MRWLGWNDKKGDKIATIHWENIIDSNKRGRHYRDRKTSNRYSPDITNMEQVKREMAGKITTRVVQMKSGRQKSKGNIVEVNRVFGILDNDDNIKEIVCTYQ